MSTATSVPETYQLEGDDALETLRTAGWKRLAVDAFERFRFADGTSHSRALAYAATLTMLPGVIAVVGFATTLRAQRLTDILRRTVERLAPGPAGDIVLTAMSQGEQATASGGWALFGGLVAALAAGTVAMSQIERGANRIYGIERDRPTFDKYLRALVLAVIAAGLISLALVLSVVGSALTDGNGGGGAIGVLWSVLRWLASVAAVVVAFALLFRQAPYRRQPAASWLAVGSATAVLLWFVFTGLLAAYLTLSRAAGETYGPLIGVIGLLLWTFLTSLALYLGLAVAAQLEAVRAGAPGPTTGEHRNPPGTGIPATTRPSGAR
jgi:YihY family inner membrane protein